MDANETLTAERSLEIIKESIERSRRSVSKEVGQSLYVAGLCTMGMALIIGVGILLTNGFPFNLLYLALPFIIYGVIRYVKRNQPPVPSSFIGTMVKNTWITFAIFALSFYVFSHLFNLLMVRTQDPEIFSRLVIHPFRIILLLMGMSVTITGYILKSRWLIWCGIIGGLGLFIWESFGITATMLSRFAGNMDNYCAVSQGLVPGIIVAVFAFIGLTLPGLMLKKQK